jgi:hypothetical protein
VQRIEKPEQQGMHVMVPQGFYFFDDLDFKSYIYFQQIQEKNKFYLYREVLYGILAGGK